jgi:iron complex outermembrane receptor protein
VLLWALATTSAAFARELDVDIKGTTIEQLMQISVTTVSRQEEELQTSAAAVYVLSREDIRRARVTSIPEALRLVPGVQVARVDANKWAVSIRGFNSRSANKLLVLVDGRSVYDPLFGGVFWEARDVALDEVERIEVIRGPGGTLWGTNAVNGVINIITRHTRDTQGTRATIGAGTEERTQGGVRYGWQSGATSHARVYADGFARDTGYSPAGAHDDARMARAGFRVDWDASAADKVMFKGDAYDGTFGTGLAGGGFEDLEHRGRSFVARWIRDRADGAQTMLQFWHDRLEFDDVNLGEDRDTYDLEFQHAFRAGEAQRLVWGAGYRRTSDDIRNGPILSIAPASRRDNLSSLFVQDEIGLAERTVRLTLGTKAEHNDYSGMEWQPSARIAWVPNPDNTFWGAVSRAVRSPSRLESDFSAPPFLRGNPDFDSEKLVAYEAGYRSRVAPQAWVDAAVFYNVYRKLLSIEGTVIDNKLRGTTSGVELAGRWQLGSAWRYDIAYTYLNMDLAAEADSTDATRAAMIEDSDPRHQVTLRSAWSPSRAVEVDAALRYVDRLRSLNVPAYLVADVGASWHPRRGLELSAVAQNLLDSHHPEQSGATTTEVQRGYYVKLRWEL